MDQESGSKDVNIKKHHGLEFREGSRLEARDHLGDKWWDAKIVEVDHEGSEVLVHFQGWNERHDEWIKMDSPRLQPLHRRSRRLSTGPPVFSSPSPGPSAPGSAPASSLDTPPAPVHTGPGPSLYSVGEEVLALWKQNRKFPATILRIQDDGGYFVRFYDGFEKVVRGQCIRRIGKQDIDFVRQCKEQIVTNGNGEKGPEDERTNVSKDDLDNETDDTPPPSKLRRERKSKFNVREILNLAPAKKSPATPTSSRSRTNSSDGLEKAAFERSDKVFERSKNGDEVKRHSIEDKDHNSDIVDLNDSSDVKSEKSVSETGSEGTPSEKENINCEMVGKIKSKSKDVLSKSGGELKGKRERKRKRFADEESEIPSSKASKKTPNSSVSSNTVLKNSKSSRVPPKSDSIHNSSQVLSKQSKGRNPPNTELPAAKKKSRDKSKSIDSIENKTNNNRTGAATINSRSVKNSAVGKNNSEKSSDKHFSYLSFDFSLPQEKQISLIKEGVNIPGAEQPLIIKAPDLPAGWIKKVVLRGVNHLKWEVIIENNLGKSFKSRAELSRYFDEQKFQANIQSFDFTLDTPLKKIRQVWRASLNQADHKNVLSNGVKEDQASKSSSPESRLPEPVSISSPKSPSKNLKPNISKDKSKEDTSSLTPSSAISPSSHPPTANSGTSPAPVQSSPHLSSTSPTLSNLATNSSLIVKGNVSETGQGVRCPLRECNKLFRNDKLLQMHVKHYHPKYAPEDSPSVTHLAFNRSLKESEAGTEAIAKTPEQTLATDDHHHDDFKKPGDIVNNKTDHTAGETLVPSVKENNVDIEAVTDGGVSDKEAVKEESLKTEPHDHPEQDRIQDTPKLPKSRPKRLRTDSMLSLSSDLLSTPPHSPAPDSAPAPATPSTPTYKMSKKRAQQLRSAPSTPPGELKDGTETMSEGEVVHCTCGHTEGDGMMVQCESCLTWQHGGCLGIDSADQVPDKYMCSVCVAPPLARHSSLYNLDMDWIREGRMTNLSQEQEEGQEGVKSIETELKSLSDLMTDLVNLSSVLHSLQVKLSVARQRNNPKVFMWSSDWDDTALGLEVGETESDLLPPAMEPGATFDTDTEGNDATFETVSSEVGEEISMKQELKDIKCENLNNYPADEVFMNGDSSHKENEASEQTSVAGKEVTDNKPVNSSLEINGDTKIDTSENQDANIDKADNKEASSEKAEVSVKEKSNSALNAESPNNFGNQLAEYFSSEGFDLQNLLPSVSEMQRMLPDVIKDISGSLSSPPSTFPSQNILPAPQPNIIPEPKRLDREECRLNLLDHIEALQKHVEDRLEAVEDQIENVERRRKEAPGGWSGMAVSGKLQDLSSAKIVNNTLSDRL